MEFGRTLSVPTATCFIVNSPLSDFCSVLFCKEALFDRVYDFSGGIALSIDEDGRKGIGE